jgi:hypothetical protein
MKVSEKNIEILNKIFEFKYKRGDNNNKVIIDELDISRLELENFEDYICNNCDFITSQLIDGKSIAVKCNEPYANEFYESGMFNYLIENKRDLEEKGRKQEGRDSIDDQIREKVLFREKYWLPILIGTGILSFVLGLIADLLTQNCI